MLPDENQYYVVLQDIYLQKILVNVVGAVLLG
jgi:hypothetical protein